MIDLNKLVINYQQEDNEAIKNDIFTQIYKYYYPKFKYVAHKFYNEDFFQELCIALIRALQHYKSSMNVKFNTFFWKIARNHIHGIIYYNNAMKRVPTLPLEYLDRPINNDSNDIIKLIDIIEDKRIIQLNKDQEFYTFLETDVYQYLKPQHIAFIKLYLCGYTLVEIHNILNISISVIQSYIKSIKNNKKVQYKFREYLNRSINQTKKKSMKVYSTEYIQQLIHIRSG